MVSIPGDGEKCKRVNLRCGEKAFGLRRRETNQGIERKGKRSRELRGRRGQKGKQLSEHLLRDPARNWISA